MEESHIYAIANDVEVGEGKYPAISAQRREKSALKICQKNREKSQYDKQGAFWQVHDIWTKYVM